MIKRKMTDENYEEFLQYVEAVEENSFESIDSFHPVPPDYYDKILCCIERLEKKRRIVIVTIITTALLLSVCMYLAS